MEISIHKAKATLTKLISAAEQGEKVVITRHGRPVVELKPVSRRGRFDFSADNPERAKYGLDGPSVEIPGDIDDPAFSLEVLGFSEEDFPDDGEGFR